MPAAQPSTDDKYYRAREEIVRLKGELEAEQLETRRWRLVALALATSIRELHAIAADAMTAEGAAAAMVLLDRPRPRATGTGVKG